MSSLADRIDTLLPQTQCRRCGYDGCRPYAEAMAAGEAEFNRCPPGGEPTLAALAELLDRAPKPLDKSCGEYRGPTLAVIDEAICIGCTKCIQACPVDAILGAAKRVHTVIADECTGCELCIPPCPVDCIELVPATMPCDPDKARRRYESRLQRRRLESNARKERKRADLANPAELSPQARRAVVLAAITRARARRQ